jgi:hypothetical protein
MVWFIRQSHYFALFSLKFSAEHGHLLVLFSCSNVLWFQQFQNRIFCKSLWLPHCLLVHVEICCQNCHLVQHSIRRAEPSKFLYQAYDMGTNILKSLYTTVWFSLRCRFDNIQHLLLYHCSRLIWLVLLPPKRLCKICRYMKREKPRCLGALTV